MIRLDELWVDNDKGITETYTSFIKVYPDQEHSAFVAAHRRSWMEEIDAQYV